MKRIRRKIGSAAWTAVQWEEACDRVRGTIPALLNPELADSVEAKRLIDEGLELLAGAIAAWQGQAMKEAQAALDSKNETQMNAAAEQLRKANAALEKLTSKHG